MTSMAPVPNGEHFHDSLDPESTRQAALDPVGRRGSGWRCVGANNVTNKGDITNAYATKYSAANGDSILYFAMEKYVPQGTNNVGIWFLQDKNVGCLENGTGNGNAFDGIHKNGDILV